MTARKVSPSQSAASLPNRRRMSSGCRRGASWTQLGKIGRIEPSEAHGPETAECAAACGGVRDGMKIPAVEPDVFQSAGIERLELP